MMIKIKDPDLLAIFLTLDQHRQLTTGAISENLISIFEDKCKKIFPDMRVYSNIKLNFLNFSFIETNSELDFLLKVSQNLSPSESGDRDIDEVYLAYIRGICPLLDTDLSANLIERHKKYISQYSFSENIPPGIIPTLISREFISTLPDKLEINFHDYLLKNINNYDTEIYYESPDLRNLRLDFSLNTNRSQSITNRLLQIDKNLKYKDILPTLKDNPDIFRGAPSYLELEVYRGCEYRCTFCPRTALTKDEDGTFIKLEDFRRLLVEMNNFNSDYSLCFGGMGEPLHHPNFLEIFRESIDSEFCKELIIETALYSDINELVKYLPEIPIEKRRKIVFIINLTTINEKNFYNLYPDSKESVTTILEKIKILRQNLENNSIYVQMLKIKEIETEIEEYFNFFENLSIPVILQKYNSYAGRLPEKRVSNLTPINREFCWHLARDLYIRADGNVAACKQSESTVIGNIKSDSLQQIWRANSEKFTHSFRDNHGDTGLPCLSCDEWYTFNG